MPVTAKTILSTLGFGKHSQGKAKEQSIFLGLLFGFFGLASGIVSALSSHSLTIESEILKNACLITAVFLSYLSVRKANTGKSEGYNYGYGKLESISGLIVAVVLIISLIIIIFHVVERFIEPIELSRGGTELAIVLSSLAMLSSIWMWRHDHHLAREEYSPVMESLWRMYRTKTLATGVVLTSLISSLLLAEYPWAPYIDQVGSLIVAGFIMKSIYSISILSVHDLLDQALEESLQLVILRELAQFFDDYEALHGIRSRRSGANVYIEIFLEFDGDRKMTEVQKTIDSIKNHLEEKINNSQIIISPATSDIT
jgi:ferrous-iron efflux pump FieF